MRHQVLLAAVLVLAAVGLLAVVVSAVSGPTGLGNRPAAARTPPAIALPAPGTPSPTDTVPEPDEGPPRLGAPWGSVPGLLQFRGNPTHTFYGLGPVPATPEVQWRHPDRPMCTDEVTGYRTVEVEPTPAPGPSEGATPQPTTRQEPIVKRWCGTGWTGQPVVWERPDGTTEVIVGAYDGAVHFLDAATGIETRPPFATGDMIKGTVTLDPDGFPLLYTGSRDGYFRVVALDRPVPTELWRLGAHPDGVWNNDWDGNASIVDDILYVGGEDSWFYAIELHRDRVDGLVTVEPTVLVAVPGFDDALFRATGDRNVSIESSVVVHDERAFFVNSGGRVVGLDVSRVRQGEAPIVFDHWLGDDADASLVMDAEGMLYASVELERATQRALEVGQLVKLDPSRPQDPVVWGVHVPPRPPPGTTDDGGLWSTPALYEGRLYVLTHPGDLLVVDAGTGEVVHQQDVGYHEWSSPVVVEDPDGRPTLLTALCEAGSLRAWDLDGDGLPTPRWDLRLPSGTCIESTPAVWKGGIWVGTRDGFFYGIGEAA